MVVLAGTVAGDPVTRRMPSGDEIQSSLACHTDVGVRHVEGMDRRGSLGIALTIVTLVAAAGWTSPTSARPPASPSDVVIINGTPVPRSDVGGLGTPSPVTVMSSRLSSCHLRGT